MRAWQNPEFSLMVIISNVSPTKFSGLGMDDQEIGQWYD